jgi:hypothetical protein
MSTNALCDALRVWATDQASEQEAARLQHAIVFFERLREHRNFYVHSVIAVHGVALNAYTEALGLFGSTLTTRARRSYMVMQGDLKKAELKATITHAKVLSDFLAHLHAYFFLEAFAESQTDNPLPRPPLPDNPPLPEKLLLPPADPTILKPPRRSPRAQ